MALQKGDLMISQRIRNFKLGTLHRTQVTGSAGMALLLTFAQDLGLGKEFCDQGGTEVYRLLAVAAGFLARIGSSGAIFAAVDIAARPRVLFHHGLGAQFQCREGEFSAKGGNSTCRGKRKCLSFLRVSGDLQPVLYPTG